MSLVSQIASVVSIISAAIKSDRARLTALEGKTNILGTAQSAAKSNIAVGGRTSIVLTATGVSVGNMIVLHPATDIGAGMNISHYYVSGANQITVWLSNTGLIISSIPATDWKWAVIR